MVGKDAGTSELAAQRPQPAREKMAADEHGFGGSGIPAQGHITAMGNTVVDLTTPSVRPAPAVHLEDAKLLVVTGARDNIQQVATGSSEAKQPPATVAAASKQDGDTVSNVPPEAKLPGVTHGNKATGNAEAQQPNAAIDVSCKQDEGIGSNVPKKAKLLSVAAEGARNEPRPPRNTMLCGKTTNAIQSGKTKTTFSAFDLPLPTGAKKSKKKRKPSI